MNKFLGEQTIIFEREIIYNKIRKNAMEIFSGETVVIA